MKDGRCITPEHRITVHKKPKQRIIIIIIIMGA
jgi:hypothetical protein